MKPTSILLLLAACGGTGAPKGIVDTADADAPTSVPALLPFWAPLVPVQLDDQSASWFLLDSGAARLYLDTALAEQHPDGLVGTVTWGGQSWSDVETTSYDLSLVSGLLGVEVSGILGANFLVDRVIGLDYRAGLVYPLDTWDETLDYGADVVGDFEAVPFDLARQNLIVLPARFEGLDGDRWVVLDTGTSSAVISPSLAEDLGVETDGRTVLRGSSAVSGSSETTTEIVRLSSVTVGGHSVTRAWASIAGGRTLSTVSNTVGVEVDAILGGTWLREHLVAIDYPNQQLIVSSYGDLSHIKNEFESVGVEIIQDSDSISVYTVFEGSDAEAQGVQVGEVLTSLDGIAIDELGFDEVQALLHGQPGTRLTLGLAGREVEVLREDLLPYLD